MVNRQNTPGEAPAPGKCIRCGSVARRKADGGWLCTKDSCQATYWEPGQAPAPTPEALDLEAIEAELKGGLWTWFSLRARQIITSLIAEVRRLRSLPPSEGADTTNRKDAP